MTQPYSPAEAETYRAQERAAGAGRGMLLPEGKSIEDIPAWDRSEYATPEASGIEIAADGSAAFFASRIDAWHQLGTVVPDDVDAETAIRLAHLDWKVEKHPIQTVIQVPARPEILTEDGVTAAQPAHTVVREVPGRFATVRENPFVPGQYDVLGDVGAIYTPVQNIDTATDLNAIAQETGAYFSTAGSLFGGKRTFVSMRLPSGIMVAGRDAVDLFLVAENSHDGSGAYNLYVTPIRTVCTNTCRIGRKQAVSSIKLRHTTNVRSAIENARDALQLTNTFMTEFSVMADKLASESFDKEQLAGLVDTLWAPTENKTGKGKGQETKGTRDRRADIIMLLDSPTQDGFAGTKWGAYNAITEYCDWISDVSSKAKNKAQVRAERIASSAPRWSAPKEQALALLLS